MIGHILGIFANITEMPILKNPHPWCCSTIWVAKDKPYCGAMAASCMPNSHFDQLRHSYQSQALSGVPRTGTCTWVCTAFSFFVQAASLQLRNTFIIRAPFARPHFDSLISKVSSGAIFRAATKIDESVQSRLSTLIASTSGNYGFARFIITIDQDQLPVLSKRHR